jgi:hypothetical protein
MFSLFSGDVRKLLAIADRALMDTTKTYLPEDAAMNDTVFSIDGKIRHDVVILAMRHQRINIKWCIHLVSLFLTLTFPPFCFIDPAPFKKPFVKMKHVAKSVKEAGMGASRETEMVSGITREARFVLVAMIIASVGTESPATMKAIHDAHSTYAALKELDDLNVEAIDYCLYMLCGCGLLDGGNTTGVGRLGRALHASKVSS